MVRKNDARNSIPCGNRDLERVVLHVTRDGANNGETGSSAVVRPRAQNEGGTTSGLFMSFVRREREPDEIAHLRHKRPTHQDSLP